MLPQTHPEKIGILKQKLQKKKTHLKRGLTNKLTTESAACKRSFYYLLGSFKLKNGIPTSMEQSIL